MLASDDIIGLIPAIVVGAFAFKIVDSLSSKGKGKNFKWF